MGKRELLAGLGVLAGWCATGEGFHHYQKLRTIERMRAELPMGARVLNVGCKYFTPVDSWRVTNLDIVPRNVPNFVQGDVRDLSMFPDKSFQGIFCSHCLEHIPVQDVPKAMEEMRRVVKDPKHIYIVLPSAWFPQTYLHPEHNWIPMRGRMYPNTPLRNWGMLGSFLLLLSKI